MIQTLAVAGERNLYLTGEVVLVSSAFGEGRCRSTYLLLGDSFNLYNYMLGKFGPLREN